MRPAITDEQQLRATGQAGLIWILFVQPENFSTLAEREKLQAKNIQTRSEQTTARENSLPKHISVVGRNWSTFLSLIYFASLSFNFAFICAELAYSIGRGSKMKKSNVNLSATKVGQIN